MTEDARPFPRQELDGRLAALRARIRVRSRILAAAVYSLGS